MVLIRSFIPTLPLMFEISAAINSSPYKTTLFNDKLSEISTTYRRWFESTADELTGDHKKLGDYLRCFVNDQGFVRLHVKDDLPLEITNSCKRAFHSVFGG